MATTPSEDRNRRRRQRLRLLPLRGLALLTTLSPSPSLINSTRTRVWAARASTMSRTTTGAYWRRSPR
ncbi:hypothetical protein CGRA01v4_01393 [Colletotrichum graminicola]|nr:hypothetical protein CGRA01v4_01393 [Colletotrichum graminicola]